MWKAWSESNGALYVMPEDDYLEDERHHREGCNRGHTTPYLSVGIDDYREYEEKSEEVLEFIMKLGQWDLERDELCDQIGYSWESVPCQVPLGNPREYCP